MLAVLPFIHSARLRPCCSNAHHAVYLPALSSAPSSSFPCFLLLYSSPPFPPRLCTFQMAAVTVPLQSQCARVAQTETKTHCLCLHIVFSLLSAFTSLQSFHRKENPTLLCMSTLTLSSPALLQFSASSWVCSQMAAPENSRSSPAFHCFPFCLCVCARV